MGEKLKGEGRRVCCPRAWRLGAWFCELTPAPQQGPFILGEGRAGTPGSGSETPFGLSCAPFPSDLKTSGPASCGCLPAPRMGQTAPQGSAGPPEGWPPRRSRTRLSARPLSCRARSAVPKHIWNL